MDVSQPQVYFTALAVGLLGGVHCLTMCGGLVATLTLGLHPEIRRDPRRMLPYQLVYNLARISGYAVAGALFGALGSMLTEFESLKLTQRLLQGLAAVIMVLLGLYLAGWSSALAALERLGAPLWRRLEPIARPFLPVQRLVQAAVIGFIWAWLPCGLVYSLLIMAMSSADPRAGALIMLTFGLGTLPNLLGLAFLAGAVARLTEHSWIRRLAGLLVIGFGLAMIV
ncbi:sulfite exporter TauE/SafE family protein [Thermochromatium tepidum]|uniref:Sulfite exporter TauE/SafE family protein n=1 Tax=Thermochromatium tepidum ATCC 43061 TaxID=316276 RepID=A0A6I6DYY7_THETI|nr:sulfite exporter TauE/SafE family protein [Thermochromatium tepidum]QGU31945.1 sulfite exporter TauE/SafE family protein [Thermochromatium tepidum ATCC 43061]